MGLLLVGGWVSAPGCGRAERPANLLLESPSPALRVQGIVQAGERSDRSAVPALVDRLEDEDEAVRFYAILALERLTGTRRGYDYGAPEAERRAAVDRWRRSVVQGSVGETASDAAARE